MWRDKFLLSKHLLNCLESYAVCKKSLYLLIYLIFNRCESTNDIEWNTKLNIYETYESVLDLNFSDSFVYNNIGLSNVGERCIVTYGTMSKGILVLISHQKLNIL